MDKETRKKINLKKMVPIDRVNRFQNKIKQNKTTTTTKKSNTKFKRIDNHDFFFIVKENYLKMAYKKNRFNKCILFMNRKQQKKM